MLSYVIILFLYFYLYFFGRGAFLIFSRFSKTKINLNEKIFSIRIFNYFPIISLFLIGNFSFIINFFFPINFYFLLLTTVPIIGNIYNFKNIDSEFKEQKIILVIALFLSFGVSNLGFHYDAGLYHLNHHLCLVY